MDISNKTSVAVTKESTGKCLHASIDDQLSNPHNAECVHPTNKQRPNANKSLYTKGRPGAAVEPTVCNRNFGRSQPPRFEPQPMHNPFLNPAQCGKPMALGTPFTCSVPIPFVKFPKLYLVQKPISFVKFPKV